MGTIPCPGCRTELEPSATVCPICLRPRGKLEITRAFAALHQLEKQRRQRPFVVAGYLLAASAAGGLLYDFHEPLIAACASAQARALSFFDDSMASADPTARRPAATPPAPQAPPPAAPARAAPAPPAAVAAPAAAPALAASVKAAPKSGRVEDLPLPTLDPDAQWAFYGRVFDLITLLPVPGAQLIFTTTQDGPGNMAGGMQGLRSDAQGRFAVVLRRLTEGSYEIRASRTGYATSVLYESDIPYARLSLAERREIARSAQDGDVALPPLTDVAGEASLRRDVFLAPSR